MSYSLEYKGYLIDYAPIEVERCVFGAQWTIRGNDTPIEALPFSSGDLGFRGAADEMAEIAKREAKSWIDPMDQTDKLSDQNC
ncbi:hypothetical protein [Paraburkholderia mimosarum]|uniref:hypothetical protein n=1 Tax=Paraburkholderia mimosarum TaxID=312026 RepID=UPI0004884A82|nr:hypothetical protein [Paraburkholderia mimosarum]